MLDRFRCMHSHVFFSLDIYYVFHYDIWRTKGGGHMVRITPNNGLTADINSPFRLAFRFHIGRFDGKCCVTSVTDRPRPYPDYLFCYCI